jgi:hypothetical protein
MNPDHKTLCATLTALLVTSCTALGFDTPYQQWKNGPPSDPDFFPIAVWLQSPKNASRYQAAGINVYVGLWRGPTSEQLGALKQAGMRLICSQSPTALSNINNPLIIGWMHGDEPDNAQARPGGKGYGPPILPQTIVSNYHRLATKDSTRPVLLNLGQGVAWDNYIGRGVRRNHPEDYPDYILGCDIASFDIYPAVHSDPPIAGKLEYVAKGVERLVDWGGSNHIVWNCIEASRISNTKVKPTATQIKTEVWMSLIHGSRGLIYFVHQFKPVFQEASLLEDEELLKGVTAINAQVRELAPVLNSPTSSGAVTVENRAIATMVKSHRGAIYLFAVNMRNEPTQARFTLQAPSSAVEVLGEHRKLSLAQTTFSDAFAPYAVHLYRATN